MRKFVTAAVLALLASTLSASRAEEMAPVFGPTQYTRAAGRPQTFTETFEHCGTAACQMVVINGNADGTNRISSASIALNGVETVGPSDFNQNVARIVKPVVLADENQLAIRLASNPGGFVIVDVECVASPAILSAGEPGVSLLDPTTLLSAFHIVNTGTAAAENVVVTAITLTGGTPTTPTLPFNIGTIPAGGSTVVNVDFSGGPFTPGSSHVLTIRGTYAAGGSTFCFALDITLVVPPASPGLAVLTTGSVLPNRVSGGGLPAAPPSFDDEINPGIPPVPTAPFVPGTPTLNSTATQMAPTPANARSPIAQLDAGPIVFLANDALGLNGSTTAEPSGGANGGGVVFVTANSFAAYSTDGGATFTQLNPTTIFPNNVDGGFCCDQIVQYVPSIDRFIWLMQFRRSGTPVDANGRAAGPNRMRMAAASPADIISSAGTAWTFWDLTSGFFGLGNNWLDYPDLSVGDNFLYMSADEVGVGLEVARMPLSQIQAGGTIGVGFTDPTVGRLELGCHLMQDTGNEIFWAGHNGNTKLQVFSLAEGSNTYFWRDVGISSWANNSPLSSVTPDGQNWVNFLFNPTTQNPGGGFPANGIIGATRSGSQLWFAWSAGTDTNFQQPHVEMVTLDRNDNFKKTQQVQIWNNNYAFAYPALATNACTGEVGLSLEYGGNGNYENHVVGFWGDFVVYITTGSDVGTSRFGDYVTLRQRRATESDPGNLFTAFGYGLNAVPPPGTGTQTDIRHVAFGRPASSCNPIPLRRKTTDRKHIRRLGAKKR